MVSADQNRINYLPRTDTIDHYNGFEVKLSTYIVYCGCVTRNPHDKTKTGFAIFRDISQGWQTCLDISKERKDFFLEYEHLFGGPPKSFLPSASSCQAEPDTTLT